MSQKNSLGRGLGSLIPKKNNIAPLRPVYSVSSSEQVIKVSPSKIQPNPSQPRKDFDHRTLEELANSIREHGILQPLIVSETVDGYELIAGERRLRAAEILGLKSVPVIARKVKEQEKLELSLIENLQRENLNPIEEAMAYQKLIDEFNLTQEEVAQRVGKARPSISNTLRLLNLPEEIKKALMERKIYEGHAKTIASFSTPKEQLAFFRKVVKDRPTVSDTEKMARGIKQGSKKTKTSSNLSIKEKEESLRNVLGTKVIIQEEKGRGNIIIEFYSLEELNNIIKKIKK